MSIGIALDMGTSGIRSRALDLESGVCLSEAFSTGNPIPGTNLMAHLQFALESGSDRARNLLLEGVNSIIGQLGVDLGKVTRVAINGNPAELSLLQGEEIYDLAYAGRNKASRYLKDIPDRDGTQIPSGEFGGLNVPDSCLVIIPPALSHYIGADGLSMILQSGILNEEEPSLVTDFGANAEMALYHRGRVYTASAAAGSTLESRHLPRGRSAGPGVVTDITGCSGDLWSATILDGQMIPFASDPFDMRRKSRIDEGKEDLRWISGSGVISLIAEALDAGILKPPVIRSPDGLLHVGNSITLSGEDCVETGKAVGSIRAGHMTLCRQAGIGYGDIQSVYIAGTLGTYTDPVKAQKIGLIPPGAERIIRVGNTSLKMACSLLTDPDLLERMQQFALRIRPDYCSLSESDTFKKIFLLELSHWSEGMSLDIYQKLLARYGCSGIPQRTENPSVVTPDSEDGEGNHPRRSSLVTRFGQLPSCPVAGCTSCGVCVDQCPKAALSLDKEGGPSNLKLDRSLCLGVACRKCERVCPEHVMELEPFFQAGGGA